jgi:hypothetical protein
VSKGAFQWRLSAAVALAAKRPSPLRRYIELTNQHSGSSDTCGLIYGQLLGMPHAATWFRWISHNEWDPGAHVCEVYTCKHQEVA